MHSVTWAGRSCAGSGKPAEPSAAARATGTGVPPRLASGLTCSRPLFLLTPRLLRARERKGGAGGSGGLLGDGAHHLGPAAVEDPAPLPHPDPNREQSAGQTDG